LSGVELSILAGMKLGVYKLIPSYRQRCPLCGGEGCAVRHGLYFRRVVARDGRVHERFPIPRFRCRRRGAGKAKDVTFSVLPASLAPRRQWSVALMLWVVELAAELKRTITQVQTALAELPFEVVVDEVTVYRVVHLFAGLWSRLVSLPLKGVSVRGDLQVLRARAAAPRWALVGQSRASPEAVVLSFHETYFPNLLLAIPHR
jgi:hypothetical protein